MDLKSAISSVFDIAISNLRVLFLVNYLRTDHQLVMQLMTVFPVETGCEYVFL